ncbi:MAG: nucleoside phosphorylase [Ilumatobacteraceae bacterium]
MKTTPESILPILNVRAGDVAERMLVVGDPARAERISERLESPREISRNREYVLFGGRHAGVEIGVVSHGVGSAGAAVCFEELCRAGARRLVRAGTCGGMQSHIRDGAIVVAHGAARDDGFTPRVMPLGFPALASVDVVLALRQAALTAAVEVIEGVVLTSDLFYPHEVLGGDLAMWSRAGVVAVEMECAALFITAALHGVQAGAILTADGNPLAEADEDMAGYDPHRSVVRDAVDAMIGIALDVVAGPLPGM